MTSAVDSVGLEEIESLKPSTETGYLDHREVSYIQKACENMHKQSRAYADKFIWLVSLVVAVSLGVLTGNLIFGCFCYLIPSFTLGAIYELFRSHAYLDAGNALNEQGFKRFISKSNLDVSISNIREVHQLYKTYLKSQISLSLKAK